MLVSVRKALSLALGCKVSLLLLLRKTTSFLLLVRSDVLVYWLASELELVTLF